MSSPVSSSPSRYSNISQTERPRSPCQTLTKPDPNNPGGWRLSLLPLSEIHFNTDYHTFGQRIASKSTLYGLLAIAGFLLLLATINFINLSTAQATRRAKEIGIRKVLGAGVGSIITALSGEFIRLVILAFVITVPFAWWAANRWLQDFAYRTPINAWVFLGGGAGLLVVALITLSIQTIRAATANPIDILRTE